MEYQNPKSYKSKIHTIHKKFLKDSTKKLQKFVTVVGKKDGSRLTHKYFQKYDGNPTEGYEDRGYLYVNRCKVVQ